MKLALIGAGGIRTPLFIESLLGRPKCAGIGELLLFDNDPSRLPLMRRMGRRIVKKAGQDLKINSTTNLSKAVDGASLVITTIRVGMEKGRIADERMAIHLGLLAQETTGLCGFSFACRSIPALLEIAEAVDRRAPGCWIVNFTNPAGLVSQAMLDAGITRAVGVCDSASALARHIAGEWGIGLGEIDLGVVGLNHLSVVTEARVNGKSVMPKVLGDAEFLKRYYGLFKTERIQAMGAVPNEYLYYFWRTSHALQVQARKKLTRGQEVLKFTNRFLKKAGAAGNVDEVLDLHEEMIASRESSYMSGAWGSKGKRPTDALSSEGYAGVALNFFGSLNKQTKQRMVLCLRNGLGALGLPTSDVLESSCEVGMGSVEAVAVKPPPQGEIELIRRIKVFESLASRAILTRDKRTALSALSVHPLVGPDKAAKALYSILRTHRDYVGQWK